MFCEYRNTVVSLGLMAIAYEFIKMCNKKKIGIFTLEENKNNLILYKKAGFKPVKKFDKFQNKKGIFMVLNIKKDSLYEKIERKKVHQSVFLKYLTENFDFDGRTFDD